MSELVLTARAGFAPAMLLSERPGRLSGTRRQIDRQARAKGVDTIVVPETPRTVNAGHRLNSNAWFKGTLTSREFNRQVDPLVLDRWLRGDIAIPPKMQPDYAHYYSGEGRMQDTFLLFGTLGWDNYTHKGDVVGASFPNSGTGLAYLISPV